MSVVAAIAAYRAAVTADEALFNADGDLLVSTDEADASEKTCKAAWMNLMAVPCLSMDDVQAKVEFITGPKLRTFYPVIDDIVPDWCDPLDEAGPLRAFLRSLMPQPTPEPDPLLALVTEYRTKLDAFNASPRSLSQAEDTALEAKTWGPSYAVLMGGEVPNATTLPGVLAALRELHREFVDCGGADEMAIAVLPAIMAFFDGQSAERMKVHAGRVEGSHA